MVYFKKFKVWFVGIFNGPSSSHRNPVIIPREITPIDLRFEDIEERA
jgi:hypothetical protein